MDIVTHALIALVTAAPCAEQPALAAGLLAGSVIPDLDVLSRLFGKRAMIRCHQGFTHSVLFLSMAGAVLALTMPDGMLAGLGLLLGGLIHVLLDYSNTLGVKLFWPVSNRRYQRGWVFFLDAFVTLTALAALGATLMAFTEGAAVSWWPCGSLFAALWLYWCAKIHWLEQARRLAGRSLVSLIPSALVPWHFLACSRENNTVAVSRINTWKGVITPMESHEVLDAGHAEVLETVPEWRLMRDLSPAYHVVSIQQAERGPFLRCRDLRVRNFNSSYGDLDLQLDASGTTVLTTKFHV